MPIATVGQRETLAVAYGGAGTFISCHSGAGPGSTGANEISGGAPAYARVATVWAAGPSDGVVNGSQVTINCPAAPGTPITWIGLWTALSGGTFLDGYQLGTSQTFSSQGQLLVTPSFTQS
jgi:hypothetical protein